LENIERKKAVGSPTQSGLVWRWRNLRFGFIHGANRDRWTDRRSIHECHPKLVWCCPLERLPFGAWLLQLSVISFFWLDKAVAGFGRFWLFGCLARSLTSYSAGVL